MDRKPVGGAHYLLPDANCWYNHCMKKSDVGDEVAGLGESKRGPRRLADAAGGVLKSSMPGAQGERPGGLPERYAIREQEKGRVLVCVEAPTLEVRVERGSSVNAAAARKSPPGSIFLDGAAQAEPFIDSEKQVFNLDHHEGCVRDFTLATCEQAMVLVRMGLDLRKRDWTIYANEPDLDTVLAIWVLLNHIRLNDENPVFRQTVMPLVRLQGAIDAHGLEMQELVAFPPRLYLDTFAQLERLRAREVELKREGRWHNVDYLSYTLEVLREIDNLVYSSLDFEKTLEVQELAHATIADHWLVIACRSEAGIYEVEQHLRRLHGERLGIILLQKDDSAYTLRRVNHFLPVSLEAIYERLNATDPAVGGPRSGNRWGGSEEIGGSPRLTGSGLAAEQIIEICGTPFRRPSRAHTAASIVQALAASLIVLIAAVSVIALHGFLRRPFPALADVFVERTGLYAAVLGSLNLAVLLLPWDKWGEYGLRLPSGFDWLYLVPGAAIASLAGGEWFTAAFSPGPTLLNCATGGKMLTILVFAVSAELLFRGTVHGILAQVFATQKTGGRWYVSWPVAISSVVYAFWTLVPFQASTVPTGLVTGIAAVLFGIFCGIARERSGSLLPPILIHCACLLIPALI